MSSLTGTDGALFLGSGGASGKGGHVAVILGVAGLNFFLGVALFLFSVVSFFSDIGISFWEWRSELVTWCWDWNQSHLISTSRKVFIFLMIVGCGESLMFQGLHLISWVILSLLKICIPCIDVIFTSMSTTSTGSLHLMNPCGKLHSGWNRHTISKMKYL